MRHSLGVDDDRQGNRVSRLTLLGTFASLALILPLQTSRLAGDERRSAHPHCARRLSVLVKKALAEFLPDRPVAGVETMEEIVRGSTDSKRLPMLLLSGFPLFALVLTAVGIAGVVSFSVTQDTRESGLRVALGARGRPGLVVGRTMSRVVGTVALLLAGIASLAPYVPARRASKIDPISPLECE